MKTTLNTMDLTTSSQSSSSDNRKPALPVSKISYNRLVGHINSVFATDPNRGRIVKALDRYLEGDTVFYLDRLPREYRMAFQMLVFEIEAAMKRSSMARERNRSRRMKSETSTEITATEVPVQEPENTSAETDLQSQPSTLAEKPEPANSEPIFVEQKNEETKEEITEGAVKDTNATPRRKIQPDKTQNSQRTSFGVKKKYTLRKIKPRNQRH